MSPHRPPAVTEPVIAEQSGSRSFSLLCFRPKPEVLSLVCRQANLFDPAMPAIVPQHPTMAFENRKRFVAVETKPGQSYTFNLSIPNDLTSNATTIHRQSRAPAKRVNCRQACETLSGL
jgi:hypothetical protein